MQKLQSMMESQFPQMPNMFENPFQPPMFNNNNFSNNFAPAPQFQQPEYQQNQNLQKEPAKSNGERIIPIQIIKSNGENPSQNVRY